MFNEQKNWPSLSIQMERRTKKDKAKNAFWSLELSLFILNSIKRCTTKFPISLELLTLPKLLLAIGKYSIVSFLFYSFLNSWVLFVATLKSLQGFVSHYTGDLGWVWLSFLKKCFFDKSGVFKKCIIKKCFFKKLSVW